MGTSREVKQNQGWWYMTAAPAAGEAEALESSSSEL